MSVRLLCVLAALSVAAPWAGAQDAARRPSSEEMVRRLAPAPAAEEGQPQTRGLGQTRSLGGTRNLAVSKGIAIEGGRSEPPPPPSIDLDINFEYNSAVLTPDARIVLDNLGRALGDPALKASRFEVAGHTDGSGGDAYNQTLSERRARAVADYLAREHGVAAARLQVVGYGKSRLFDAANPQNALNRRVQVVNLGQN